MSWCPQPLVSPCSSIRPMPRIPRPRCAKCETAARAIGLQIQVLNASTSREIDAAFATSAARAARRPFRRWRRHFSPADASNWSTLAARHAIPAIYARRVNMPKPAG